MAHIMALAPQGGTYHGTQQGVPSCLNTKDKQCWQMLENYITWHNSAHASPLHVIGTVCQTQSQGYENATYQVHSRLWEHCFPSLPRHLGEEARLPPLTLQMKTQDKMKGHQADQT